MTERLTEPLLAHIDALRGAALTANARDAALCFVRDSLGVALSGACIDLSRRLQTLWCGEGSSAASVWGTMRRCSRDQAAMLNAFAIHNQEFDCVHEPAVVHPMAVVLASLLTEADALGGVSGDALLRAVVISIDVAAAVGVCARAPMRFFRPAMCGALGAAAGIAVLREFDPQRLQKTLGLAYSQLSGTMQAHVEGLPTLALQIAFNARAALTAADLAGAGLDGPRDWLEGSFGYFSLIDGEHDIDPGLQLIRSATRAIEQISHKPFPTGRAAHGTLDVLTELLRSGELHADDVDRITLRAPPLICRLIGRPLRSSMGASYARLCLPYLASTCLVRAGVGLDDFSPAALTDARRAAYADRITIDSNGVADENALAPQIVVIRLRSGATLERTREAILGAPALPLSPAQQSAKFSHCLNHADPGFDSGARDTFDRALQSLPEMADVRELVATLRPPAS